ncbi:MAG: alanine--tRNA ligase [Gemmataceae bacterium]|nr:alanine--tRNA ligase [Gemmataceae bacterium]
MPTANEIRQQFLDFFCQKHGHTFVPSSPVVPEGDPTLLFANAGMNQFKPYFLGTEKPPYPRAANTQKCIRAGGKHNDLDDVGKDTYHHTFFEMLGNWSFGDYFKKEAIQWAWELLTEVWRLDKSRLHVTVFEGDPDNGIPRDDEAADHWRTVAGVEPAHIHYGNKKDNFWEMGETGPCGPCTEIHIDRTADKSGASLVNKGSADVIEIWNLVFIQFNRNADKSLTPLPAKHVDTGMGFERVTAVLQGKTSNYDTDVFTPIMDAIGKLTGKQYGGRLDDMVDTGFRVIADHLRMATFAITDGARPGNKKRDAVLRSVIRRAVRFGYQYFERREPFMFQLVPTVVEQIGAAFPELTKNPQQVMHILRDEEAEFFNTVQRGLTHFEQAIAKAQEAADQRAASATEEGTVAKISGDDAAHLQTTYGFPIDLTAQMALEKGLGIDLEGYQAAMERHREISGQGREKSVIAAVQGDLPATDDSLKYKGLTAKAKIVAWVKGNLVGASGKLGPGDQVGLVLNKTNFYAEQGGQVGDQGWIKTKTGTFEVADTQRLGDTVLHTGRVHEGSIKIGQPATLEVSGIRADTMRNHTTTHLLNWALRKVLGEHIEQKGSLVDAAKTRFDFAHDQPLTPEQVAEVERLVNEKIYADLPVIAEKMPLEEAKKLPGVRAVFGEKYPDPVRVLVIGARKPGVATLDHSIEFCGGTHLTHTGEAGFFKIVSQELVGKGVRRVTAVTGKEAVATVQRMATLVDDLTGRFRCRPEDLSARIDALQDEIKKLQQQVKKGAATDLAGAADKLLTTATQVNGSQVIVGEMPAGPEEQLRSQVDRIKQKAGSAVVLIGWVNDDKVGLLAAATDDLVQKGVHAGKLVGEVAKLVGGGGGGRPNMAQAGGKEPGKLGEALVAGRKLAEAQLTK